MHRSYLPNADLTKPEIAICDSAELHHLRDVLRLKIGDTIVVFNAIGMSAKGPIVSVSDGKIVMKPLQMTQAQAKECQLILVCAMPKKDKFEWIIEKTTEIGVDQIIPIQTKRTEVIITPEKQKGKSERFHKIALNAAKQSGCGIVPQITDVHTMKSVFEILPQNALKLIPALNGKFTHIRDVLSKQSPQSLVIFIGPEGDFTPQEVDYAIKAGCQPISLGSSVLKVETAAIAAISFAKFLLCDK